MYAAVMNVRSLAAHVSSQIHLFFQTLIYVEPLWKMHLSNSFSYGGSLEACFLITLIANNNI